VCIHVTHHAAYQPHKQSTHLVLPTAAVSGARGVVAAVLTALKYTEQATQSVQACNRKDSDLCVRVHLMARTRCAPDMQCAVQTSGLYADQSMQHKPPCSS
jgi:hypothetical protein